MKKKLLKIITLALSIMPMTALHAMDEQQPNNNNNQSYLQCAANYVTTLDYKHMALWSAGFALSQPISTAAHELGHAAMAEIIKPGSVKQIEILSRNPGVLVDTSNLSPMQKIAIAAAGPITGILGSYAAAKSLQLLCSYQKKRTLREALEEARNTPILTASSEQSFVHGAKDGFTANIFLHGTYQLLSINGGDGSSIFKQLFYLAKIDDPLKKLLIMVPWDTILSHIPTMSLSFMKTDHYLHHLKKRIVKTKMGDKEIMISPSILMNLLPEFQNSQGLIGCLEQYI